jgi:hypothetical protein
MKQLKEFFDEYTIKARIFPALTVISPLIIIIGINLKSLNISVNALIIISLITFLAIISRNLGKNKENKIIRELGAFQTTILLRYSDSTIDSYTKTRYHKYLNRMLPELDLPELPEIEDDNKHKSDDKYNSAVRWLRNNRRDKKKYPLVIKDLITYGYARNLFGLKNISIIMYFSLIVFSMIYFYTDNKLSSNINELEIRVILTELVLLISLITMIFGINKQIVISQGYAYARSILETCDE